MENKCGWEKKEGMKDWRREREGKQTGRECRKKQKREKEEREECDQANVTKKGYAFEQ